MQIAVISDLHLGRGDQADRGHTHDQALLRLLDYLETHYDKIILLGDVWELLTSAWPRSHKKEITYVQQAHSEIAERFKGPQYHYIIGNHDYAMGQEIPTELILKVDELKIRFTHGHKFDVWANELRYIGEFVVWVSGWAARFGTHALTRFFDWFHNLITGTSKDSTLGTLEWKVIQESLEQGVGMTVIGHTHLPGITRTEGHLLVNSGYCLDGTFHFVGINTHQAEVTVNRVQHILGDKIHDHEISVLHSSSI